MKHYGFLPQNLPHSYYYLNADQTNEVYLTPFIFSLPYVAFLEI
jgi:hypothetical protein